VFRGWISALGIVSLAACGAPEALTPNAGDTAPERTLTGERLRDHFTAVGEHVLSQPLDAPEGATRVGFFLDVVPSAADRQLHFEARGVDARGEPGEWREAMFTFVEHPIRVGRVDLGIVAFAVEVRLPATELDALSHLTFSAIVPEAGATDPGFDALAQRPLDIDVAAPVRTQGLDLTSAQPRSAWGARPTNCSSLNQTKTRITVHHTVTPTSESDYTARLRGIQAYHMDSRGWCDVGYHFLVTSDGTTWEGREAKYLGTHVGGNNTNNLGVSFVGCFHTSGCNDWTPFVPPDVMLAGAGTLIGEAAAHYGISIDSDDVIGHRDNPNQTTSCPGDNLHGLLPDLRSLASGGAPGDSPPPDDGSVEPPPPGSDPQPGVVQGVVWDLAVTTDATDSSDARLPGTTISCDCGESTIARDDDAFWSLDLQPGVYTITATRDGYATSSREVQVTEGGTHWASIGVAPVEQAVELTVLVYDVDTGARIGGAYVEVTGADPAVADALGELTLTVVPGDVVIRAAAEGYEPNELTKTVGASATAYAEIALAPVLVGPEPEGEDQSGPGQGAGAGDIEQTAPAGDVETVTLGGASASGGIKQACACVLSGDGENSDPTVALAVLGVFGLLLLRRRRR
jgi:MYXO-CTERM domain-containing protein